MRKITVGALRLVLIGFLSVGLYGAASVSYTTITGSAPCPSVGFIPACFVVFAGYFLMLMAVIAKPHRLSFRVFIIGWMPVFLLAIVGSSLELLIGNACPKAIPDFLCVMCLWGWWLLLRRYMRA